MYATAMWLMAMWCSISRGGFCEIRLGGWSLQRGINNENAFLIIKSNYGKSE